MMHYRTLKKRWVNFFGSYAPLSLIEPAFEDLVARYSEDHRHYHTLRHLAACLCSFDEISQFLTDSFSVEAALWFHDVVYFPRESNNEEFSAEYCAEFLHGISIDKDRIAKITDKILLTKHPSQPSTEDEKFLVDIDLTILGSSTPAYEAYEGSIREEYFFVGKELYANGRRELLASFLRNDRLYLTDYFYEKLESKARENLTRQAMLLPLDGIEELGSGPVNLRFERIVTFETGGERCPFYHFKVLNSSQEVVGHINFRIGETRHITLCAGHIGFEVLPQFRGHSYSYFASLALLPLVKSYYKEIILTADPSNFPSRNIIERLGAIFLDEIEVPEDDPAYFNGARRKRRYKLPV